MFQPAEIGCTLVRDARWLERTFGAVHEYMRDADMDAGGGEVNLCDRGVQLTRGFRALKLWMTIKVHGLGALREAVARGFELARKAESALRAHREFEIITTARMGIVSFRYTGDGLDDARADAVNSAIVNRLIEDGYAFLSSTIINARTVLRLCTINPRTTETDLERTIDLVLRLGREVESAGTSA